MSDDTAKRGETMSEAEKFEAYADVLHDLAARVPDQYRQGVLRDICRWIAAQERQREERERDEAVRAMR